jgi:SAM-dependent methyltransferase
VQVGGARRLTYDVVAAFDVLEHLYDPVAAFRNLRQFVRNDGLIIVETGDSDGLSSRDLPYWSYLNLVEHHLAWNKRSLAHLAERAGLRVVRFERKRHKLAARNGASFRSLMKYFAYRISPTKYAALYRALQRPVSVASNPIAQDHFRAILRPCG